MSPLLSPRSPKIKSNAQQKNILYGVPFSPYKKLQSNYEASLLQFPHNHTKTEPKGTAVGGPNDLVAAFSSFQKQQQGQLLRVQS